MELANQKPSLGIAGPERYRPISKLGYGGMADVFLGVQLAEQGFERLVVIKRINAQEYKNDHSIQMFIDEARIIGSLNHPHIVRVYDLGRVKDQICITMEYIDGENLEYMVRTLRKAQKSFPLPIVFKLVIEACEALHYAHTVTSPDGKPLNLVHRDIGAQNLMIDSQGYLKLIDFGIAKSNVQTEFTLPGLIKGKLAYLAPDVFKFKDIDGRVDLYAMGLVLYELLTMTHAFSFTSEMSMPEIINSILQDSFQPPREINSAIHPELEAIIYKAADKDRDKRYQTGEEFVRALYDFAYKHDGIASTSDIKNWFQTEFKQRIEQRRKFEQLVQEKANRIKKKTTNSGIISIPAALNPDERPKPSQPEAPSDSKPQPLPPPQNLVIASKHTNPYLVAAAVFLLFIGAMVVVRQLFLTNRPTNLEITAPIIVQETSSQPLNQQADSKPTPATKFPPATTVPSLEQILEASAALTTTAVLPPTKAANQTKAAPAPTRKQVDVPEDNADDLTTAIEAAVAEPEEPKDIPKPPTEKVAVPGPVEKPTLPPLVATLEPFKIDQPTAPTEKPAVVATINLLSGNGNWSGEQVANNGCSYCHAMDWKKKTKSQWLRFITRGHHNQHRDLSLYFSKAEVERLLEFISERDDSKPVRGIVGAP